MSTFRDKINFWKNVETEKPTITVNNEKIAKIVITEIVKPNVSTDISKPTVITEHVKPNVITDINKPTIVVTDVSKPKIVKKPYRPILMVSETEKTVSSGNNVSLAKYRCITKKIPEIKQTHVDNHESLDELEDLEKEFLNM
jgi:hypothetical protein